jgi:hypothetical protein
MGSVVSSNWLEWTDRGSNRLSVETCVNLGVCNRQSYVRRGAFFLIFFIAYILLVEKAVTRTSKTLIAGVLLTGFKLLCRYQHCIFGSFFYGGISPSKIGLSAPS